MEMQKSPENIAPPEEYSLERAKIEVIDKLDLGKLKSERLRSFPWPIELQGKGTTNEKDKTLLIRFPQGDIFLSLATTIHELGHLRQEELNPSLRAEPQTHEALLAQENDAWSRGWERLIKGNPEFLKKIEEKFKFYKNKGKLSKYDSFESLYKWIQENLLKTVEAQAILFEGNEDRTFTEDILAEMLEKRGFKKFLEDYAGNRVGEKLNEEAREFIKSILELVIKESH